MHAVGPIFKRGKERRRGKGKRQRREERGEVVECTKGRIEKRRKKEEGRGGKRRWDKGEKGEERIRGEENDRKDPVS